MPGLGHHASMLSRYNFFLPKISVQMFLDIECLEFNEDSSPRKQQLWQHISISPLLYLGRATLQDMRSWPDISVENWYCPIYFQKLMQPELKFAGVMHTSTWPKAHQTRSTFPGRVHFRPSWQTHMDILKGRTLPMCTLIECHPKEFALSHETGSWLTTGIWGLDLCNEQKPSM